MIKINFEIRKALPEEAEDIVDINIEVWHTTYKGLISDDIINELQVKTPERVAKNARDIKEKQNTYVALIDDRIVGYSTFGLSKDDNYKDSGEMYTEYILDKYQGVGIGKKLALKCMEDLYNEGYKTFITKCLDSNKSNEFHKYLGGVYVGQSKFVPLNKQIGIENIYYHKDLKKSIEILIEKINIK